MDGILAALDEIARLETVQAELVDVIADMTYRQALWQDLMTQRFREASALRLTNDRLREELRRYTASQMR